MMNNNHETENTAATQITSRRRFLIGAGGVVGVTALWAMNRRSVEASSIASTPGPVTVIQFDDSGKRVGKVTVSRVIKTDAEWQKQLSPISYDVTRRAGTERAYTGDTWNLHDAGLFRCVCCGNAVFSSATKFESGTGWPSFWEPIAKENIIESGDNSIGMDRTAVSCRECNAHLGHVFDDGPRPTGLRYCMNSAAMRFVKKA
jgi:peptide-methionine (R)-S-oxide reductase